MPVLTHHHLPGACSCDAGPVLRSLAGPEAAAPVGSMPTRRVRRPSPAALRGRRADRILVGRFHTMDPQRPVAAALAVTDGVIVALGDEHELDGLAGPGTEVLRIGDGIALPGLVEPHLHLWVSALLADWVDCTTRDGARLPDIVELLRRSPPVRGDWVLGRSFDPSLLDAGEELTRDVLDAAVPDRPVVVMNASIHFAYANSRALELAGIDDTTPDPPGGFLERSDGRLTGVVGESGIASLLAAVPPARPGALVDAVVDIDRRAVAAGCTRVHDAATGMVLGPREIPLFHEIADRFSGRVSYAVADPVAERAIDAGLVPFAGDDRCRAVSWKIICDGSNQGRSGFQRERYLGSDDRGHANLDLDALAERIALAHRHGWQVMAHANGDAAIDLVLDAHELATELGREHGGTPDDARRLRDRIEHCSLAHPRQLDRMAELGLSPSFLIGHVHYWGHVLADRVLGPDRAALLDPTAGASARGLRWSLHSDYPVTPIEPFREIQTAVTRACRVGGRVLAPAERVDVTTALRAKTVDAAWQLHADDASGSLRVGALADVIVLDRDPFATPADELADTRVLRTLVGGETVHEA